MDLWSQIHFGILASLLLGTQSWEPPTIGAMLDQVACCRMHIQSTRHILNRATWGSGGGGGGGGGADDGTQSEGGGGGGGRGSGGGVSKGAAAKVTPPIEASKDAAWAEQSMGRAKQRGTLWEGPVGKPPADMTAGWRSFEKAPPAKAAVGSFNVAAALADVQSMAVALSSAASRSAAGPLADGATNPSAVPQDREAIAARAAASAQSVCSSAKHRSDHPRSSLHVQRSSASSSILLSPECCAQLKKDAAARIDGTARAAIDTEASTLEAGIQRAQQETSELSELRLGELYQRACEALDRVPVEKLTEAFNSDNPKQVLIRLIVGGSSDDKSAEPSVPDEELNQRFMKL